MVKRKESDDNGQAKGNTPRKGDRRKQRQVNIKTKEDETTSKKSNQGKTSHTMTAENPGRNSTLKSTAKRTTRNSPSPSNKNSNNNNYEEDEGDPNKTKTVKQTENLQDTKGDYEDSTAQKEKGTPVKPILSDQRKSLKTATPFQKKRTSARFTDDHETIHFYQEYHNDSQSDHDEEETNDEESSGDESGSNSEIVKGELLHEKEEVNLSKEEPNRNEDNNSELSSIPEIHLDEYSFGSNDDSDDTNELIEKTRANQKALTKQKKHT